MDINQNIQMINIDNIIPNRFQPRLTFDEQGLNELASSIKEHGIIQPLVLRKIGDKYEIVAGERRYKAATMAGLSEVPSIISNLDDNQSAEVALVENVQRRNLTSIEEAKSYKKMLDKGYLTQEQLAKKMGVSQSTIANKLRLLNLSTPVQEALLNERISERHARSLLQISDLFEQENMLSRVINERMTVRQLDSAIKEKYPQLTPEVLPEEKTLETVVTNPEIVPNLEIEQSVNSEQATNPEAPETIETLDMFANTEILQSETNSDDVLLKPTSKLLNIFDKPAYPSLEDEKVNLSFKYSSDNIFDENLEEVDISKEAIESIEKVDELPEEAKQTVILPEPTSKIIENNIESVTTALRELETEIKQAGFKIITEEFDFEDLYQIIIKIDKQAE